MKKVVVLFLVFSMVLGLYGCSSSDYKKAVRFYEEGKYEEAKLLFEKISNYKDSLSYAEKCEAALNYQKAISLYNEGNYEEAKRLFEKTGNYEDALSYIKKCETVISYREAVSLYESGEYEKAKEIFTAIPDYEDSATYVQTISILLDPVDTIEKFCKEVINYNDEFWETYYKLLDLFKTLNVASSGGELFFETKYDIASGEFACLVDIPFMKGDTVAYHDYYGFAGHMEFIEVVIDDVDSIELVKDDSERVDSFWAKYWKH